LFELLFSFHMIIVQAIKIWPWNATNYISLFVSTIGTHGISCTSCNAKYVTHPHLSV
jgi:hypothetical protein